MLHIFRTLHISKKFKIASAVQKLQWFYWRADMENVTKFTQARFWRQNPVSWVNTPSAARFFLFCLRYHTLVNCTPSICTETGPNRDKIPYVRQNILPNPINLTQACLWRLWHFPCLVCSIKSDLCSVQLPIIGMVSCGHTESQYSPFSNT